MSCANHPLIEAARPCARCGTSYCDDCVIVLSGERLCESCKAEALRDVFSGTRETPLQLATVGMRFAGLFVDRVMFAVVTYPLGWSFRLALRKLHFPYVRMMPAQIAIQILFSFGFYLYEAVMVQKRGQTLGKMLARVRVASTDGTPVTRRQAWLRAAIRFVTAVISTGMLATPRTAVMYAGASVLLGAADLLPALFTKERTALHDLLARTRVFRVE